MMLEADCRGYIETLSDELQGQMDILFSTWGNISEADASFPITDVCPNGAASTCGGSAKAMIADVKIRTSGSSETPPPPEVKAWNEVKTEIDGSQVTSFVKGLESRDLSTVDSSINIGHDNRAFIFNTDDDSTVENTV